MHWPPAAIVSTTIMSSSCTLCPSGTPIQNSSGVASSVPRTRPATGSGMDGLRGGEGGEAATDDPRVAEPTAELRLERADGQQVLGGARIADARGREGWQQHRGG